MAFRDRLGRRRQYQHYGDLPSSMNSSYPRGNFEKRSYPDEGYRHKGTDSFDDRDRLGYRLDEFDRSPETPHSPSIARDNYSNNDVNSNDQRYSPRNLRPEIPREFYSSQNGKLDVPLRNPYASGNGPRDPYVSRDDPIDLHLTDNDTKSSYPFRNDPQDSFPSRNHSMDPYHHTNEPTVFRGSPQILRGPDRNSVRSDPYDSLRRALNYPVAPESPSQELKHSPRDSSKSADMRTDNDFDLELDKPADLDITGSYRNPAYDKTSENATGTIKVLGSSKEKSSKPAGHSRESSRRCCGYRVLLALILVLVILALLMTGLFIWKATSCNGNEAKGAYAYTANPTVAPFIPGACNRPDPIELKPLPKQIRDKLEELTSFVQNEVELGKATAVSASLVYRDEVIWSGGFGVMDKSANPPVPPTPDTIFPCASVSKVFTALMLFIQLNNKKISSIDDTVVQYEPEFSVNNPFNDHKITFYDLVTQMSGLPREAPCYEATPTNLCPHDYDTMMRRIKNKTLVLKPQTTPQYSNLGLGLLGQVLFKYFGSPYNNFGEWIGKEILEKLGMTKSKFTLTDSERKAIPLGYTRADEYSPVQNWGWLDPAGGLFTTVTDLAKFQISLMSDSNEFLSRELTQRFLRPVYVFYNDKVMTGMSWEIEYHKGYLIRMKKGYIYGYDSIVAMVPELRLGLSFICTDCNDKLSSSLMQPFREIVTLFHGILNNVTQKAFVKPPDARPFLGRYNSSIATIDYMDIKEYPDKLVMAVNGHDVFFLNYKSHLVFTITPNPVIDCATTFTMGVKGDEVIFGAPHNGTSSRFLMYGAHPSGLSYFYRIPG
ncbi:beta-lactamase-like protein 2 isoform X1 [Nematostella vectensis]|uniref:beta-lactamase-like protein 2 isoform X1 n=1 Tax=Nematostella vectensis TaxID=45351 RepID=UPI0020773B4B|nr:beta-lactamase-like protein 2 isoform X1 [Nematostella vectensis]